MQTKQPTVTHSTYSLQQLFDTLQEVREQSGLNKSQLAAKAGVTYQYIRRLESGELKSVQTDKLSDICAALGFELRFYTFPIPAALQTP